MSTPRPLATMLGLSTAAFACDAQAPAGSELHLGGLIGTPIPARVVKCVGGFVRMQFRQSSDFRDAVARYTQSRLVARAA